MTTARTTAIAALAMALLLLPGCMTQEIEYVDESGNVLAVDETGKPILPGQAVTANRYPPAAGSDAELDVKVGDTFLVPPRASSKPAAKPAVKPVTPPPAMPRTVRAPAKSGLGTPPAGVSGSGTYPVNYPMPARAKKAAPVNSSAGLEAPPTGS